MTTLQRFKCLATQCAMASPSRSPSASPAKSPSFHLRRHHRRTLRSFLGRCDPKGAAAPKSSMPAPEREEKKGLLSHTSLKDLFVSSLSPPPSAESSARGGGGGAGGGEYEGATQEPARGRGIGWSRLGIERFGARTGSGRGAAARWRSGSTLRCRLLRRAWRPVLLSIPE